MPTMKVLPFFKFYPSNWLVDTMSIPVQYHGSYLCLLIYQWQHGHIPATLVERMDTARLSDVGEFDTFWSRVKHKFEPFETETNQVLFRNEPLNTLREASLSAWQQKISASQKGVKSRKRKRLDRTVDRAVDRMVNRTNSNSNSNSTSVPVPNSTVQYSTARASQEKKEISPFKKIPPTLEVVSARIRERGLSIDPEAFCAYYEARGWKLRGQLVKNWDSCLTTWSKNGKRFDPPAVEEEVFREF